MFWKIERLNLSKNFYPVFSFTTFAKPIDFTFYFGCLLNFYSLSNYNFEHGYIFILYNLLIHILIESFTLCMRLVEGNLKDG